jgi:hypothetical protein
MQTDNPAGNNVPSDPGQNVLIGQRLAFAAASLAIGICSFISALGIEKAVLAIVFGALALKNAPPHGNARLRLARFGIVLGIVYIVLLVILLIVFREQAMRFLDYVGRFQAHR